MNPIEEKQTEKSEMDRKIDTAIPHLEKVLENIRHILMKAGIDIPTGEFKIELPMPEQQKTNKNCVYKCRKVCIDGGKYCAWWCYWDCTVKIPTRPPGVVYAVTCKYDGKEYSEGAPIVVGGKTYICRHRIGSPDPDEGNWEKEAGT